MMKRVALFSLNDTSDAEYFAAMLIKAGWDIIASKETVNLLRAKGLPVQDIAEFTGVEVDYGFPPTLHAKVEFALTSNNTPRIDLVYVIPYPLSQGNDVGGRTLLALAVKGRRIPVMCVEDMRQVVSIIQETGEIPDNMRMDLVNKACFAIAEHYFSLVSDRRDYDAITGRFAYRLMNGENPYQVPAAAFSISANDPLAITNFRKQSGDDPCFTNMADADCILNTMCLAADAFRLNAGFVPYLCLAAKHGNACGMGASKISPEDAVNKALFGNPRSIWGGELITNFPVDSKIAEILLRSKQRENILGSSSWMLDIILAPSFTEEAISILGKRKERKLLANLALIAPSVKTSGFAYRFLRGGYLRQPPASYILNISECSLEGNAFSEDEVSSLLVAWSVAFSSNHGGNEIALAKNGTLLSCGGGPSTVEAAKVAVARSIECGHDIKDSAFAADAFFPFTDAPQILCTAGATIGLVPSGGKRELEVRGFFSDHGVTVAYLPEEYRGFCRH